MTNETAPMDPKHAAAMYMAAWDEPDENARRAILDEVWVSDGVYVDPLGRADGREGLVQHIAGYQQQFAGHTMEPTTGVDAHDGYLRFSWHMLDPDGNEVMEGVDFGSYDDNGRITLIVGFFGPWPDLA